MSRLAKCCMLWFALWDRGSSIAQVRRAWKFFSKNWGVSKFVWARLECACMTVCRFTHVDIFPLLNSFPQRDSQSPGANIYLCLWMLKDMKSPHECWRDEKKKKESKGMQGEVFCMGLLARDSICVRGCVFYGRCMCVLNCCVRSCLSLCAQMNMQVCLFKKVKCMTQPEVGRQLMFLLFGRQQR